MCGHWVIPSDNKEKLNIVTIIYIICSFSKKSNQLSFFISKSCFFPLPLCIPLMFSLIQVPFGLPLRQIMSHTVCALKAACSFVVNKHIKVPMEEKFINVFLFVFFKTTLTVLMTSLSCLLFIDLSSPSESFLVLYSLVQELFGSWHERVCGHG